ncbi:MAG: energy transducer TonB [Rikenellaceae bacterium]|jgi:protein TonB|nr:energy transducer TonB [Rikenellaceae bacterium]
MIGSLLIAIAVFSWGRADTGAVAIQAAQAIVEPEPDMAVQKVYAPSTIINVRDNDRKIDFNVNFDPTDEGLLTVTLIPAGGKEEKAVEEEIVFINAEVMPKFQGGDVNRFRAWVMERLKYPVIAAENNIQGRVMLSFVVEKDGRVTGIEVLASPDRSLSEETVRVVSASPEWKPGEQRGMAVRVCHTLPVEFRLGQ